MPRMDIANMMQMMKMPPMPPPPKVRENRASPLAPSKVLHVHGLPANSKEKDLLDIVREIGKPNCIKHRNHIFLPHKCQAFIEFESIEVADAFLMNLDNFGPPKIRTKRIYFQYSSRPEITTQRAYIGANTESASKVLLIHIQRTPDTTYIVQLSDLLKVLLEHGKVLRIILFAKRSEFRTLVEMATIEDANEVKYNLDGAYIFLKTQLNIQYSKKKKISSEIK